MSTAASSQAAFRRAWNPSTYYKGKSRYGGMDVAELARVRELEKESCKSKRM
jgi:hypothetical protein